MSILRSWCTRQGAVGEAPARAAAAIDGVVVARVDGVDRNGLRDLAVSVRDQDSVHAVVLGAELEAGGVALVAAVTPDSQIGRASCRERV